MSGSLWLSGVQHARLPCPSPTPGACSNTCPLSWCYHPTISSSVIPFSSHPQSFPASETFSVSQFFASGGQAIGASASASVLLMNIQDWFPLGLTGLISLLSKGLWKVNKRFQNAVLGCSLKNNRMIFIHFQGKPFIITVIQAYALTTNAREAEQFCDDLQGLLELMPKKDVLFIIGDWNAKVGSEEIEQQASLALEYKMKQS